MDSLVVSVGSNISILILVSLPGSSPLGPIHTILGVGLPMAMHEKIASVFSFSVKGIGGVEMTTGSEI